MPVKRKVRSRSQRRNRSANRSRRSGATRSGKIPSPAKGYARKTTRKTRSGKILRGGMDIGVNDNAKAKELAEKWWGPGLKFHNPEILKKDVSWYTRKPVTSEPVTIGPELKVNLDLSKILSNVKLTSNGLIVQKIPVPVAGYDGYNYKVIGKFDFDKFDMFKFNIDKDDNQRLEINNKTYKLTSYDEDPKAFPAPRGKLELNEYVLV
jgi:hypothetical protein